MATYYTSSTALGGGVGSYADPFTLQEAFDTATAGDEVRILNDGTYSPTATINVDTNAGTSTSPIVFRGRNSGDTAYEMATISGSSLPTDSHILDGTGNASFTYTVFEDLRLTAASGLGAGWSQPSATCRGNAWRNCRIDNFPYKAMQLGFSVTFYNCEFHDNNVSLSGINGPSIVSCCTFRDGDAAGSNNSGAMIWYNCVFYNHSVWVHHSFSGSQHFINCTFDGGAYAMRSGVVQTVMNCLFTNFTTQALEINAGYNPAVNQHILFVGNYFYNNTSDINSTPNDFMTANNTFAGSDPLYVSTTLGAEDYNLQSGSPALGTGVPSSFTVSGGTDMTAYTSPGAFANTSTGGGGATLASDARIERLK